MDSLPFLQDRQFSNLPFALVKQAPLNAAPHGYPFPEALHMPQSTTETTKQNWHLHFPHPCLSIWHSLFYMYIKVIYDCTKGLVNGFFETIKVNIFNLLWFFLILPYMYVLGRNCHIARNSVLWCGLGHPVHLQQNHAHGASMNLTICTDATMKALNMPTGIHSDREEFAPSGVNIFLYRSLFRRSLEYLEGKCICSPYQKGQGLYKKHI